jgi:hypothetical protein
VNSDLYVGYKIDVTLNQFLPSKKIVGDYLFVSMGALNQLQNYVNFAIVDRRDLDVGNKAPQLAQCNIIVPTTGGIAELVELRFLNMETATFEDIQDKEHPQFSKMVKLFESVLDQIYPTTAITFQVDKETNSFINVNYF